MCTVYNIAETSWFFPRKKTQSLLNPCFKYMPEKRHISISFQSTIQYNIVFPFLACDLNSQWSDLKSYNDQKIEMKNKTKQEQLAAGSKGKPQKEFLGIASDVSWKKRLSFLFLLNHSLPSSPFQPRQKCNCRKWEVSTLLSSKFRWGKKVTQIKI